MLAALLCLLHGEGEGMLTKRVGRKVQGKQPYIKENFKKSHIKPY